MPSTAQTGYDPYLGVALYNTKIKIYPDGRKNIIYSNRQRFHPEVEKDEDNADDLRDYRADGSEQLSDGEDIRGASDAERTDTFREDVLKRNRERVFDIVFCNEWSWFLTITFDPKKVDFSNVREVMPKLTTWLGHRVQRNGLRYILIPERFKKTNGIHCHALINDAVDTTYSGRIRWGKKSYTEDSARRFGFNYTDADKIYNVPDWGYGFSTALPITENAGKLSVYLTKYITKGNDRIFGRYYWSSRNIDREPHIEYTNSPYDEIDLPEFEIPGTGYKVKYDQQMEYTRGNGG